MKEGGARGTGRLNDALHGIILDDNSILAELLLDKNDLLCSFHNKVASRIQRTFSHPGQLSLYASA